MSRSWTRDEITTLCKIVFFHFKPYTNCYKIGENLCNAAVSFHHHETTLLLLAPKVSVELIFIYLHTYEMGRLRWFWRLETVDREDSRQLDSPRDLTIIWRGLLGKGKRDRSVTRWEQHTIFIICCSQQRYKCSRTAVWLSYICSEARLLLKAATNAFLWTPSDPPVSVRMWICLYRMQRTFSTYSVVQLQKNMSMKYCRLSFMFAEHIIFS